MTWRIPLTRGRHATIISAYAPTLDASDASKDCFYSTLDSIIQKTSPSDKLLLLGDFNARVVLIVGSGKACSANTALAN